VDPARGVVVIHLALAVPVEVDAHATELVGVDLLARRAHHGRALDAGDLGLGRDERRR
jgi:hypothetical protein